MSFIAAAAKDVRIQTTEREETEQIRMLLHMLYMMPKIGTKTKTTSGSGY